MRLEILLKWNSLIILAEKKKQPVTSNQQRIMEIVAKILEKHTLRSLFLDWNWTPSCVKEEPRYDELYLSSSLHLRLPRRHYAVNGFYPGFSVITRYSRSFSWSPDRLMLEYLEMSFRIRRNHVVFGLPADLFHVFTKVLSDLLAGVSEGKHSRWPNHDSLLLHIVRLHGVTLVRL